MTNKSYTEFKTAVGLRESSGKYHIKNKYGYLGKYQFGMPRLADLGLVIKTKTGLEWIPGLSEEKFLHSPELQEKVFDVHVAKYRVYVWSKFSTKLQQEILGVRLTTSGAIACCHLLGPGGLSKFIRGEDTADANGTKASQYVRLFCDYDIPPNMPMTISHAEVKSLLEKKHRAS